MASPNELRRAWAKASDDEIIKALFVHRHEYEPEAIEILADLARQRGIEPPRGQALAALRQEAAPAEDGDLREFLVLDQPLACVVCSYDRFREQALPTGAPSATRGAEAPGKPTHCVICGRCGYMHWFC
jgi:hypothetical protein